jgi:hypothetical protein
LASQEHNHLMPQLPLSETPRYYALHADSDVVYHSSILTKFDTRPVKFILRQDEVDRYMLVSSDTSFYTYTAVDKSGVEQPIRLSNFEILRTEKDRMQTEGVIRTVIIRQIDSGEERALDTFTESTWHDPSSFLSTTMVELMADLELAGSFRGYDLIKENEALKIANAKLKTEVERLKVPKV